MNNAEIDALFASAKKPAAASAAATAVLDAPPSAADSFTDLGSATMGNGEVPMAMLLDLTLPVSIELGRTSMTVQEILRLGRGSVVQLEKLAGEPIDIYVGDRRFAEGEVVVLGEHFGVRITRILQTAQAAAA
ncbi:MAG: flagellar motor switch protein FliN [Gemmatimonadaceae bacterium]|jgi:flagellar motor switch protein FliN/FliY|nr:flagellar motor switch protein FliN [Gemmatimonadaceae bacterium]